MLDRPVVVPSRASSISKIYFLFTFAVRDSDARVSSAVEGGTVGDDGETPSCGAGMRTHLELREVGERALC